MYLAGNQLAQLAEYISNLYNNAIGLGAIAAVIMIVIGSLYFTISGGSPDKKREGRDIITSAIWGLVLLLGSFLILSTINPQLVSLSDPSGSQLESASCAAEENRNLRQCADDESPFNASAPKELVCCVAPTEVPDVVMCPDSVYEECGRTTRFVSDATIEIPDCDNLLRSLKGCSKEIKTINVVVSPTKTGITELWEYGYYPSDLSPESAECLVWKYQTTLETEDGEEKRGINESALGLTVEPGLRGLAICPSK